MEDRYQTNELAVERVSSKGAGGGLSIENPVVVSGDSEFEGIDREYQLLEEKYGERGREWQLERQSLVSKNVRHYDKMDIVLKNGTKETVWFDITAFFGR